MDLRSGRMAPEKRSVYLKMYVKTLSMMNLEAEVMKIHHEVGNDDSHEGQTREYLDRGRATTERQSKTSQMPEENSQELKERNKNEVE